MITNYTVTGMTCEHCAKAITEEVSAIAGVDDVTVTLEPGAMVITSSEPVDFEAVKAAVAEAGDYQVEQA